MATPKRYAGYPAAKTIREHVLSAYSLGVEKAKLPDQVHVELLESLCGDFEGLLDNAKDTMNENAKKEVQAAMIAEKRPRSLGRVATKR